MVKDDIRITYTGIRPGEKMFEELMNKDEIHPEQVFEKIYRGKVQHMQCNEVNAIIQDIVNDFSKEKLLTMPMAKREIIMFDDKILLITGGTGSFGNAVMKRF